MNSKQLIIRELKGLLDGSIKPARKYCGLCKHIYVSCDEKLQPDFIEFKDSPNFSGEDYFPVPSLSDGVTAEGKYMEGRNLWDKRTKYGKERYKFVKWSLDTLEAQL